MTLRPATASDVDALTALAHAAKAHWGYPSAWLALWRDELTFTDARLAAWSVWCADLDGRVVGVCSVSTDPPAELENLWVSPAAMGQGIGRALMTRALRVAADAGATELVVVADPHAVDFYRRFGAIDAGAVPSLPEGRSLPRLVVPVSSRLR